MPHPRPAPASRLRLLWLAPVLLATAGTVTRGQEPSNSLARYIPKDKLVSYLEFDGLDAHAESWRGSAMYKILNTTKTGAMLEELGAQVVDKVVRARVPNLRLTGSECVALVKAMASSGFLFAEGTADADGFGPVVVIRNAFGKDTKALYGKLIASITPADAKPVLATVANHRVVHIPTAGVHWWVDDAKKQDLIISMKAATTPAILEAIDGIRPNGTENATIAALAKSETGMNPVMRAHLTGEVLKTPQIPPALGLDGIKSLDLLWGFQGRESVSVAKVVAPKPRRGLLAVLDQPTFGKAGILPVPEGVAGFSAFSVDPQKLFDDVIALVQTMAPGADEGVKKALDDIAKRSQINVRDDVLAQMGPKVVVYSAPGQPAPAGAAGGSGGGFNPLSMLTGGLEIPKTTIVAEIPHPAEFARTLDKLVIEINKQLRTAMPAPPAPPAEPGAPKKKAEARPSIEFRPLTTLNGATERGWTMAFPPELNGFIPKHVRPTIRLSGKTLVFSVAADSAKQAIDLKSGGAATKEFAEALQPVSGNLLFVGVDDPRGTLPGTLAGLPGKLQTYLNRSGLGGGAGAPPVAPGGETIAGGGQAADPQLAGAGGPKGGRAALDAGTGPGSGIPGGPGAGIPGGPGAGIPGGPFGGQGPGGPGGEGSASAGSIVLSVDPVNMPKADEIKALLFASVTSVTLDDQGLRIVSREAFPNIAAAFAIPAMPFPPGLGGPGGPPPGFGAPPPGGPGGPPPGFGAPTQGGLAPGAAAPGIPGGAPGGRRDRD